MSAQPRRRGGAVQVGQGGRGGGGPLQIREGRGAARLRLALVAVALLVSLVLAAIEPGRTLAAATSPHWSIVSESQPTDFSAGADNDAYVLVVRDDGSASTNGEAVHIADTLPAGVSATNVTAEGEGADGEGQPGYVLKCPEGGPFTGTVTCTYGEEGNAIPVLPGAVIVMTVTVSIPEGVTALGADTVTISGGGAPSASTSETTPIATDPAPFGMSLFDLDAVGAGGEADIQAASHPFELTTTLAFAVAGRERPLPQNRDRESPIAAGAAKDLQITLPPGVVGNPQAVPRCSQQAFLEAEGIDCPLDTQVGTVKPFFYGTFGSNVFPVYDIVPAPGEPAELGFSVGVGRVPLFLHVRENGRGEYALAASLTDIPEAGPLQGVILTLWGVPAASSHDREREGTLGGGEGHTGKSCAPALVTNGSGVKELTGCPSGAPATPFLTLPSGCADTWLGVEVEDDTWEQPGLALERFPVVPLLAESLAGCEALWFSPTLTLAPESTQAGATSGYTVDVHVPQDESPTGLATPELRRAQVTLPAGVELSASVANGLEACSASQFEAGSTAPAQCPVGSRIGSLKVDTPMFSSPLEGPLYVGTPQCSPCDGADAQDGRLLRLLAQVRGSGVTVKLEGSASIDQATGQLTASFDQLPELPFEDLELELEGGERAPLVNASTCGTVQSASSRLTPYSSEQPAEPSSEAFELGGCSAPRFDPTFLAGTTDNEAGASGPLTVTLSRTDADEDLQGLSVKLAPGLLGLLSTVVPCPVAQAQEERCGPASQLGTASVGAGPGADPTFLSGSVYLTGPYEGAPYGLSVVVPAIAGPFDLGTLTVAARVSLDPSTAALTISSDPLLQSLDGIPLELKTIELDIDRPGFVLNPTDCRTLAIEGTASSVGGRTATLSSRFQAADCASLKFAPKLTALAHGHTSKAQGVHLHVRIRSAAGRANVSQLKLDLPASLVPRLSTLQHACVEAVFQASPSGCPEASAVGTATILTPLLRQPLDGSVYVVSRGGAAPPEVAVVLKGEGLTVEVLGETSVKGGVAAAIFRSLPDVPFSELDLLLDAGPHSLLSTDLPPAADGSLCGRRLAMPTEITGQNGAVVKQTTTIAISGCGKLTHR